MNDSTSRGYDKESKTRIAQLTAEVIDELLIELPDSALKRVFRGHKPPRGFRQDTPATYRKLAEKLARRLTKQEGKQAVANDYASLEVIWAQYLRLKLDADSALDEYLSQIATLREDNDNLDIEDLHAADNALVENCLRTNPKASRDVITQTLLLAPFQLNQKQSEKINELPTQSDIETRARLAEVPERLMTLEDTVFSNQQEIRRLDRSLLWVSEHITDAEKSIETLAQAESLIELRDSIGKKVDSIAAQFDARLQEVAEDNQENTDSTTKLIEEISNELSSLNQTLIQHDTDTHSAEILSRLEGTENKITLIQEALGSHNSSLASSPPSTTSSTTRLFHTSCQIEEEISGLEPLVQALLSITETAGVRKRWRKRVGLMIGASILDGQVLALQGDYSGYFASFLADTLAEKFYSVATSVGTMSSLNICTQLVDDGRLLVPVILRNATLSQASIAYDDLLEELSFANVTKPFGWFNAFPIATLGIGGLHLPLDATFRRKTLFLDLNKISFSKGEPANKYYPITQDLILALRTEANSLELPEYATDFLEALELPTANCLLDLESSYRSLLLLSNVLYPEKEAEQVAAEMFLQGVLMFRYGKKIGTTSDLKEFANEADVDLEDSNLLNNLVSNESNAESHR